MNIEELQTAIGTWDEWKGYVWMTIPSKASLAIITGMEAARLVANLDPTVWDDMLAEAFYGESFMDLEEERQWVREFEYELVIALGLTPPGATDAD